MKAMELQKWSRRNWNRVPEMVRNDCLNELRGWVPKEVINLWVVGYKNGRAIGSETPNFHFLGGGMAIRNRLRNQLTDGELPAIVGPDGGYPVGEEVRNWDDVYLGALEELVEKAIADDAAKPPTRA